MEKSHKIYNLIFDFLLAAVVCFYNDLRFMRFWFLGGQLYTVSVLRTTASA